MIIVVVDKVKTTDKCRSGNLPNGFIQKGLQVCKNPQNKDINISQIGLCMERSTEETATPA